MKHQLCHLHRSTLRQFDKHGLLLRRSVAIALISVGTQFSLELKELELH